MRTGYGDRFITIPQDESYEGYNDMAAFIETVSNPRLQAQLEYAIQGKDTFRRYKDLLLDHPKERERWFVFEDERHRSRVLEWLVSEGIEPTELF